MPGRRADDLGRQRRAAHPAEHDVVEPLLDAGRRAAPAISPTSGREDRGRPTHDSRIGRLGLRLRHPTAWRPGRRACWRTGRRPAPARAARSRPRPGRRRRRRGRRASLALLDVESSVAALASSSLDVGEQLAPGLLELVDALALEDVRRRRRRRRRARSRASSRPAWRPRSCRSPGVAARCHRGRRPPRGSWPAWC